MKRTLVLVSSLLSIMSVSAYAIEINQHQLDILQQQAQLTLAQKSLVTPEITEIWQQQQQLESLHDYRKVSVLQRGWVKSKLKSKQKLTIANPDHPHQKLVIVDIAKQAKALESLWDMQLKAKEISDDWKSGNVNWKLLLLEDKQSQRAVSYWLYSLSTSQAERVAEHLLLFGMDSLPKGNALLGQIAEMSQSSALYKTVWQRPTDEFSYQLLQRVPFTLEEDEAVSQLIHASRNEALLSQALFLLATHFSSNKASQQMLVRALEHPSQQWLAASVVGNIQDEQFASHLLERFKSSNSSVAQHILNQLEEAKL